MPHLPFLAYPYPKVPNQAPKPLSQPPVTNTGARAGTLGPNLHVAQPASVFVPEAVAEVTSPVAKEPSEKDKLIDYCASAGVSIDKRWGVERIKKAIADHKPA